MEGGVLEESPFKGIDRERLVHPPEHIAAFVRRMTSLSYRGVERRAKDRHPLGTNVIAQPIDADLRPIGPPFVCIARDISTTGVGVVHTAPISTPYLAVELAIGNREDQDTLQIVVEIQRCRAVNERLYDIGGTFLMRLPPQST